ncbi:MAG: cell division protein FtsW [Lachnospiraceae bacterium]|nr:cell division protein FtsW [Lachnospiraceae bacterium]
MKTGFLTLNSKLNREKAAKEERFFDYTLLFIVIFLVLFGLVMMYSVSSYKGFTDYGDSLYYFKRQIISAGLGFVLMIVMICMPEYVINSRLALIAYGAAVMLQAIVIMRGSSANGSVRWLYIFGFRFQPSELAKIIVILAASYVVSRMGRQLNKWYKILILFLAAAPLLLLVAIENLTSAVILAVILFAIVFVAGRRYLTTVPIILIGLAGIAYMINGAAYRGSRIQAWLNVETSSSAYQIRQALYAIGSGGVFGKGLGQGIQKEFIPEAHTDMIFSCICEELGIIGAVGIIILFILLMWRCIVIANNAPDLFSQLVVVGVMTHIGAQTVINIAVATNTMPNTGVTLPFISYGGTSLMVLLAEMGLVLGVSRRIKLSRSDEEGSG